MQKLGNDYLLADLFPENSAGVGFSFRFRYMWGHGTLVKISGDGDRAAMWQGMCRSGSITEGMLTEEVCAVFGT